MIKKHDLERLMAVAGQADRDGLSQAPICPATVATIIWELLELRKALTLRSMDDAEEGQRSEWVLVYTVGRLIPSTYNAEYRKWCDAEGWPIKSGIEGWLPLPVPLTEDRA